MLKAKIKYAFILQLLILSAARVCIADDNWSINEKSELPPVSDENRIIKWCDDKTNKHIRFSSANIAIKGYHPCGTIVNTETCDAEGNKILGKPKSGIFKSCEKKSAGQSSSNQEDPANPGLSHSELKELKHAMKEAAEIQNSDPEVQLQILADQLLASFTGGDKDLMNLANTRDPQKLMDTMTSRLEKSLPLLDEDTRKLVEPLLKNLKKAKY